jgi:polysaccharide biosynthesis protein PslG
MARPGQLTRYIVCALITAALCASAALATTTSGKRKKVQRTSCTVRRQRTARQKSRPVRRKTKARPQTRHAKRKPQVHRRKRTPRKVACTRRVKKPPRRPEVHATSPKKVSPSTPAPSSTTSGANATAAAGPDVALGVVSSVGRSSDQAQRMSQIETESGAKWMREMFDWSMIEPRSGTYDFSHYDGLMTLASQNGVHIVAELFTTPSWAGATPTTIPDDPTAFANFVAAVVARYGPQGSFWAAHPTLAKDPIEAYELWNEPYYDNGNSGDYNPGRYARLVKAAAGAGRAADPSAKFLLAAENQSAYVNGTWVWWIDALYAAVPDLNSYFDGVAVHPYGTDLVNVTYPTPGQAYTGYDQIRRVESIHQEFASHGAAGKLLWLTEIGWPTCTNGGSVRCATPSGQANNLQTVFTDARTIWKSFVRAVFVYGFQDNNPNTADPENDYGLVDYNGNPKPALAVFRAAQ